MSALPAITRRRLIQSAAGASVAIGLGCATPLSASSATTPWRRTSKNLGAMVFVKQGEFEKDLAATVAAGFTWIRMDIPIGSYGWFDNDGKFNTTPGVAEFYLRAVQQAKDAGLRIVLVMASMYNSDSWSEAEFRERNGRYLRAVARNIGKYVDIWQIFNEHDGRDYRNHAPIELSEAYLGRMRSALRALRGVLREFSTAAVTTTPFGYPIDQARYDKWVRFFDGVGPSLDVICVHAYPEKSIDTITRVPTYMRNLRERYQKPVGILEFGLPSVDGYGDAAEVGRVVAAQIAAVMSVGPVVASLYQLRDRGTSRTDGELAFGILNQDWTKKQYYDVVSDEVRKWR